MILSNLLTRGVTVAATAAAAAAISCFAVMDANPTLYIYDRYVHNVNDQRLLYNRFHNKNIWIIGASSGIGLELTKQLVFYGANVIVSSRNIQSKSDELMAIESGSTPGSSSASTGRISGIIPLDITGSIEHLQQAIDHVEEILLDEESSTIATTTRNGISSSDNDNNVKSNRSTGGSGGRRNLDYVVINSGKGHLSTAIDTSPEVTKQIFQINTIGPIALTQLLLKRGLLLKTKSNSNDEVTTTTNLVITSSVGGKFGVPLSSSYAASKHALHGYYNSLHSENPWLNIALLCPGPINTPFHTNHVKGKDNGKDKEKASNVVVVDNDDNTKQKKKKNKVRELKMDVQRCVTLIITSMIMMNRNNANNNGQGNCKEYWIAEQPTLIGLYINQYLPTIFQNLVLSKVGPIRIKAFKDGKNLYDPNTFR